MTDPIIFDALTDSPHTAADAVITLPRLTARLSDTALPLLIGLPRLTAYFTPMEHVAGTLIVTIPPPSFLGTDMIPGIVTTYSGSLYATMRPVKGAFSQTALEAPNLVLLEANLPLPYFYGTERTSTWGELGVDLPLISARLYDAAGDRISIDFPPLRLSLSKTVVPIETRMFGLLDTIGSVLASNEWVFESSFSFDDDMITELLFALRSRIDFTDRANVLGLLVLTLESSIVARDTFRFLINVDVESELEFTDQPEIRAELILRLASQLVLADETIPWLSAIATISSAFVLRDSFKFSLGQTVTSTIELADELAMNLAAVANLVSAVEFTSELTGTLHAFTTISSEIEFGDDFAALLSLLMEVEDELAIYTRFVTPDGDSYVGYIVNVRTAAVSELTNYPFNSFATVQIGGRSITYSAAQEGVYRHGGNDDDGDPIRARVRLGLNDFGTSQLKRVANAFIGYTSDGQLLLKTITTDGGRKKENWYKLKARSAHSVVDGRFDIAKGLTARYWSWEVENIDGADFQIDNIKVWPVPLQRYKSGR